MLHLRCLTGFWLRFWLGLRKIIKFSVILWSVILTETDSVQKRTVEEIYKWFAIEVRGLKKLIMRYLNMFQDVSILRLLTYLENYCIGRLNGDYMFPWDNCRKFVHCLYGWYQILDCEPGHFYDPVIDECRKETVGSCIGLGIWFSLIFDTECAVVKQTSNQRCLAHTIWSGSQTLISS